MLKFLAIIQIFLLTGCKPTKSVEPTTSSGNINVTAPYMWANSAFPRNLKISNEFSDAEVLNIQGMTGAWESALGNRKNFFTDIERTTEVSSMNLNLDTLGDDGVNGIYKLSSWPQGLSSAALAVTQIFGRRFNIGDSSEYVRIEHADILINDHIYNFRTDDITNGWTFDFRTVVLHELGHFLGLNHKYGDTVMIPSIGPLDENRLPSKIDATDLSAKYGFSLGLTASNNAIVVPKPGYAPSENDQGQMIKIIIELRADGECVHTENGIETQRHSLKK